jgi:hypothetical protein
VQASPGVQSARRPHDRALQLEIERGGLCMTSGLVIRDIRARGLAGLGVMVDDFEGSGGAVRFYARTVEAIAEEAG